MSVFRRLRKCGERKKERRNIRKIYGIALLSIAMLEQATIIIYKRN